MEVLNSFTQLSNDELAAAVMRLAGSERTATALLIASLAEFDRRRLYFDHGCNSIYAYCFDVLHLSEHAAYGRIEAARAVRRFPSMLAMLEEGSLSLTAVCLLARHLTPANHMSVLAEAAHKRKDEVLRIVARLRPQPDVPSTIRKLPAAGANGKVTDAVGAHMPAGSDADPVSIGDADATETARAHSAAAAARATGPADADTPRLLAPPPKPAVIAPLSPERYKIQVTVDRETRDVLRQAQDLMRHTVPNGDPAVIIARALRELVDSLLKKKAAATAKPRPSRESAGVLRREPSPGSRVIPAAVKRSVWERDRGRCAFQGSRGRCGERGMLEYHHVIPYARGGRATADNIELRCRAHNAHEARLAGLPLR